MISNDVGQLLNEGKPCNAEAQSFTEWNGNPIKYLKVVIRKL